MHLRMFLPMRLTEGVGRERLPLDGFHSYFSFSLLSVFNLLACVASVCALSRGFTYSGYRPIGSPCPFLANLKFVSCTTPW